MKGTLRVFILIGLPLLGLLGAPNSKALTPCSPTLRVGGSQLTYAQLDNNFTCLSAFDAALLADLTTSSGLASLVSDDTGAGTGSKIVFNVNPTLAGATLNGTITGTGISDYLASPPAIGGTVANTGSFTNLTVSGTCTGCTGSVNWAVPGAIGSTTPAAGKFTTLASTSILTNTGTIPTLSSCGSSPSMAAGSTSNGGAFTVGTGSNTSCIINFATAFSTQSFCGLTQKSSTTTLAYIYSENANGFTVMFTAPVSGITLNYVCSGY